MQLQTYKNREQWAEYSAWLTSLYTCDFYFCLNSFIFYQCKKVKLLLLDSLGLQNYANAGRARAPCDHKCGHLHKDLGLQSSAAESNWWVCGERPWGNCGKKQCRSQGSEGMYPCGAGMWWYDVPIPKINVSAKRSWAPGFWGLLTTNCECLVWLWMVIKMQRGSCLLDLPCQTGPEYLCAIEINDLFNLGIPDWPRVYFALSKVFFVFCRYRNL